jgi:hypothetical protein
MYTKRSNVLAQLRGEKGDLARYMKPGNSYVDIKLVDTNGLTPQQLKCNDIEIRDMNVVYLGNTTPVSVTFIRATHGHKGDVLAKMMYGQYVPYRGPNDIFCLTHFSAYGMGDITHNRPMNMLSTPDITQNKGVIAHVSIAMARARGCEFWSKIGDRYLNKVVCFDIDLKASLYGMKYLDTYGTPESLIKTHAAAIATYSHFMSPARAFEQVKRLFVEIPEDDEDADDEEEPINSDNYDNLAEMLGVLVV